LSRGIHLVAVLVVCGAGIGAAQGRSSGESPFDRFDPVFRKYTKRYFGPAFDWRVFKAQGMAESRLDNSARSRNGAQGIMQLMPSTFEAIRSRAPDLQSVDDPEMNIAAGIHHNRALWKLWSGAATPLDQRHFMFASYNAGRTTIRRAQRVALRARLDPTLWASIVTVSPRVYRWRQRQTLHYLRMIELWLSKLDDRGRMARDTR